MPVATKRKKAEKLVVVRITDIGRTLYGVLVKKTKKTLVARITERDPVWFGAKVTSRDADIAEALNEHIGWAELARTWGVSGCDDAVRCPDCGRMNVMARLDSLLCLSCTMKTCKPCAPKTLEV